MRQGLFPERSALGLSGANPQDSADHPAERRRRRELHPRAEDGSLPDLSSGDRQEGLRKVPAAVHDPSEPGHVHRQQLAASARQDRLHGLPRRHGAIGQLQGRGARAQRREAAGGVGEEVRVGAAAPVGLPDAAGRHDRGVVREVPQAADLRPEGGEAGRGLRDLRARRLLRVPQDERLRGRQEARADPHEDRRQALAGLGQELDSQSARGQADDVDAALLLQLEQQLARRRGAQRGRDQRHRRVSVRERRAARVGGDEPAARRRQERGSDRQVDRLPGLSRRR